MKLHICLFSYAGMHHRTFDALLAEIELIKSKKVPVHLAHVHDDALISRSRSKALSDFLRGDADVFFMLDHDIAWTAGELLATADMANLKKAAVAGFYSTRARGLGYAGRLKVPRVTMHPGKDELFEAEFLPGGFVAIPRKCVEAVVTAGREARVQLPWMGSDHMAYFKGPQAEKPFLAAIALHECVYFDGSPFFDFFRPVVMPSTLKLGSFEYLSEDWAFSYRLAAAKQKQFLWSKPMLGHYGEYGFTMFDSAKAAPS